MYMAEIKIEEKRSSIWPWIIGLLIIAAIIYFIVYYMNGNRNNQDGVFLLRETYNYAGLCLLMLKGKADV